MKILKKMKIKKILILLLLIPFSFGGTLVAKAETISNSGYLINDTTKSSIITLYENSTYPNYILTSNRENNGYNSYTFYYLCLTDAKLEPTNNLNITSDCNELYTIYNNSISKKNNTNLTINNSVYYTNNYELVEQRKDIITACCLIIIFTVIYLLFEILHDWFSSRGGGLKYESI